MCSELRYRLFEKKLTEKKLLKKVKKVVDKQDLMKYSIQVARQKAEHKHEDLPCRLRKTFPILYENQTEMQP